MRRIIETEPGSGTRLLVASLLNFRPRWLYPFDPALTRENGLFYLPGGERYEDRDCLHMRKIYQKLKAKK